jgi:hypothetical protein
MAHDRDRPGGRAHDAADNRDERRLARAVRSEQREDLALADIQIDRIERTMAGGIGLGDPGDRMILSMKSPCRD